MSAKIHSVNSSHRQEIINPRLARIQIHPIKSLDPVEVQTATIGSAGSLRFDRAWAVYTLDGRLVNATWMSAMHRVRAVYAPNFSNVTLSAFDYGHSPAPATFCFPIDTESAAAWFSKFLKQSVMVRHDPNGIPDDLIANGPTIISTASLDAVCSWFPGMAIAEARLRFRSTFEIDGSPLFGRTNFSGLKSAVWLVSESAKSPLKAATRASVVPFPHETRTQEPIP
jgi:uncharacterized protein YcbX